MFTGIVEKTAEVIGFDSHVDGSATLTLRTGFNDLQMGESIAVNGACLTVIDTSPLATRFLLSPETLACTLFGELKPGTGITNVERALKLSDRLSGHWVQGHVDLIAEVASVESLAFGSPSACTKIVLAVPASGARYCVAKGSITVNGVSLTINEVNDQADGHALVSLMIIPHTLEVTSLKQLRAGMRVQIETDILVKTLERLCQPLKTH